MSYIPIGKSVLRANANLSQPSINLDTSMLNLSTLKTMMCQKNTLTRSSYIRNDRLRGRRNNFFGLLIWSYSPLQSICNKPAVDLQLVAVDLQLVAVDLHMAAFDLQRFERNPLSNCNLLHSFCNLLHAIGIYCFRFAKATNVLQSIEIDLHSLPFSLHSFALFAQSFNQFAANSQNMNFCNNTWKRFAIFCAQFAIYLSKQKI